MEIKEIRTVHFEANPWNSNVMDGDGATFEYSKDIPASLLRVSR